MIFLFITAFVTWLLLRFFIWLASGSQVRTGTTIDKYLK